MASDPTEDFQNQLRDALRAQQDAYLAAVKAWRDAAAQGASSMPPPAPAPFTLPTPAEIAQASYGFAAKLLADQSKFMEALSKAMAPPDKKP